MSIPRWCKAPPTTIGFHLPNARIGQPIAHLRAKNSSCSVHPTHKLIACPGVHPPCDSYPPISSSVHIINGEVKLPAMYVANSRSFASVPNKGHANAEEPRSPRFRQARKSVRPKHPAVAILGSQHVASPVIGFAGKPPPPLLLLSVCGGRSVVWSSMSTTGLHPSVRSMSPGPAMIHK